MRTSAAVSLFPSPPPPRALVQDDGAPIERLAAGGQAAAAELVDQTYAMVFRSLCRMCGGDRELAADLTQETYRRAWSSLAGFEGRARFSTWLFRIAYNVFLNHVRRPQRLVPLEETVAARAPSPGVGQEEALLRREADERLRRAVLALPEPLRQTVAARYWGELQASEIAELEGISRVAVHKRLKRAFRVLGDALEVQS
jgi:RNA polymerase sigma-70 factor (ECF subfamily)